MSFIAPLLAYFTVHTSHELFIKNYSAWDCTFMLIFCKQFHPTQNQLCSHSVSAAVKYGTRTIAGALWIWSTYSGLGRRARFSSSHYEDYCCMEPKRNLTVSSRFDLSATVLYAFHFPLFSLVTVMSPYEDRVSSGRRVCFRNSAATLYLRSRTSLMLTSDK